MLMVLILGSAVKVLPLAINVIIITRMRLALGTVDADQDRLEHAMIYTIDVL